MKSVVLLRRITAIAAMTATAACAHLPSESAAADLNDASTECQPGAYRSPDGDLAAISIEPPGKFKYRFLDGRGGAVSDENSPVVCAGKALLVQQDGQVTHWARLDLNVTETRFSSDGATLAGMLIEPAENPGKPPLVVMAHGSENWGWLPARYPLPFLYAAQGVSVFIFDKHGTGQSEGTFHMNFRRLAQDLVAASAEARRLAHGRFSSLGIHGGSQGGWTAPLAVEAAGADFMIISFGGIFSPLEEDAEQVLDELRVRGYGPDVLAKAKEVTNATATIVSSSYKQGYEQLARVKAAYGDEPWFKAIRGDFTGSVLAASEEELRARRSTMQIDWHHDSMAPLQDLSVPTLWILAEQDLHSPVALTSDRLRMLIEAGKPIQVVTFPDTDHGMFEFTQSAAAERHFTRLTEGYQRLLADWAKGELRPPYGRARFWPAAVTAVTAAGAPEPTNRP